MTVNNIKPTKLYFSSLLIGFFIMALLLVIICNAFAFDYKSAACVYLYGGIGYTFKSILFFLPYLMFHNQNSIDNKTQRRFIIWLPFLFFFIWFLLIVGFDIEELMTDISFGYIMWFPHFYLQLLSVLFVCILTAIKFKRTAKKMILI